MNTACTNHRVGDNGLMLELTREAPLLRPLAADFAEILPVWRECLWQGRQSGIEPVSAIAPDGQIDLAWMQSEALFWKVERESEIIGVVSLLFLGSSRLRGLWVAEAHRGRGLAKALIQTAIASRPGARFVWTMARQPAVPVYQACGFKKDADVFGYEFGPHVLMRRGVSPGPIRG